MSKVIIEERVYKGIPYNIYVQENIPDKGLVVIQHGFESNKNRGADYLAVNLARLGYKAVSIDAYKHGNRIEEPYISDEEYKRFEEAFDVIDKTSDDIVTIYNDLFKQEYSKFDLIGVSMGGMIAYNVSIRTTHIRYLIPVISTPEIDTFAKWLIDKEGIVEYYQAYEQKSDLISRIDPVDKFDQLNYQKMFILNGTKDDVVPHTFSEEYFTKHHTKNTTFKLYDEGHSVNKHMQREILEFITNEKVVL